MPETVTVNSEAIIKEVVFGKHITLALGEYEELLLLAVDSE